MGFKDIIGQQKAKRVITGMLKKGRLPHALLFTGDAGVGKLFTAKNLVKTLNCLNPIQTDKKSETPQRGFAEDCCDTCRVCRLIDNFNFSDLLFIQPEGSQIKIDTVRDLNEFLSMSPYEAKMKSVIINEAERLNLSAANALLKALEEPPLDSLIILISEKPEILPDTIRSRCVRIHFSPLPSVGSQAINPSPLRLFAPSPYLDLSEYEQAINILKKIETEETSEEFEINDREQLLRFIEMALILLRDRIIDRLNSLTGAVRDSLPQRDSAPSSTFNNSGRWEDIQVIIENYKRLSALKVLMPLNLNLKITWNYLRLLIMEKR